MSVKTLKLSELHHLTDSQRDTRVAEFVRSRSGPLNGEVEFLNEQLAKFEGRYEMSSETMRRKSQANEVGETQDICRWLMLLDLRDRLVAPTP